MMYTFEMNHTPKAHKIPENKLEHEVFTVEAEQCLEQTERNHAQLQGEKKNFRTTAHHSA